MTAIGQSLGEDVCKALPALTDLTGCDSTSAFVGKGRRSITVESDPNMCELRLVIRSAMTTNGSKDVLGSYAHCTETRRRVRYKLFCSNNAQTCNLPPSKDALKYHVARAN